MIQNREQISSDRGHELALDCLEAGIRAADPAATIPDRVSLDGSELVVMDDRYDLDEYRRILVVGAGNAAATVAKALEGILGDRIDDGIVVTDNPVQTSHISVLPGDHPVPSKQNVRGTREVTELVRSSSADDLVLCIITGGGSALFAAPAAGIGLGDLQQTTDSLLASGANIEEINTVRKHLSDVKGGQLAALATPATIVGIVVSDVVGNQLDVIASGPLTPDETTFQDAEEILKRYDVQVPKTVTEHFERGRDGNIPETPFPGEDMFEKTQQYILIDGYSALEGAATVVQESEYEPLVLSSRVQGEAREAAKVVAAIADECVATGTPVEPPAVLLSGGETTVTIRGDGVGGPNQEFVLSAALELDSSNITVASIDTDGIDGNSTAAGGIATREMVMQTRTAGDALAGNNAGEFLQDHDGVITTGATNTNVNDLRVIVVADST